MVCHTPDRMLPLTQAPNDPLLWGTAAVGEDTQAASRALSWSHR
jgi:hypothetical protein